MNQSSSSPDSISRPVLANLDDAIRQRAEDIYLRSGRIAGNDLDNWAQAEQEILRERLLPGKRRALLIELDGVLYVGEYNAQCCDGYQPGEFETADEVPVRFEGEKMFVRRPNGKELETKIVNRVG